MDCCAGLILITVGGVVPLFCTVNPLMTVSTSAPVVTVTFCACSAAPAEITSEALAVVAPVTVIGPAAPTAPPPTAMPGPKLAVVVPFTQLVNWPVSATGTVEFGTPMFGEIRVMAGVPACTLNALFSATTSVPVVTVTVR